MLNIGNFTSENNPCAGAGQVAAPGIDTWTSPAARTGRQALGASILTFVTIAAGVAADCVTDLPRRMAARMFSINDDEAYWRGWQIIKVHAGFGRRYRDPRFDTLVICARCLGTGIEVLEVIEMDMRCGICLGTGRLTIATADGALAG